MDFSSANAELWNPIIQFGIIGCFLLLANILRRKIKFIKNSLMPTAVLAGFILLILKTFNILPIDSEFLEVVTYHALALGFIALSLRIPEKKTANGAMHSAKSGALIVSTYLVQAVIGLAISILLAYTFFPDLFKASGILLPMAYGQGPGQANNVGATYEALGMTGGRSFGLSLAAVGYLVACIVGVIYLNVLKRKGKINRVKEKDEVSGSVTVDVFQDKNEIPIAESVDKLSVQIALVLFVYLLTYGLIAGLTSLVGLISEGMATSLNSLLWGFNFIVGSMVAMACRGVLSKLRKHKIMNHQYQNNYLLNRISGFAFDVMIIAGIASINIGDLSGAWIPFILMAVLGGIGTFFYLKFICKKLCPNYPYESFFSMFGMLTGTISSGVLLLREIDPEMKTPASNDLISGSSFGIVFGIPVLLLVNFAPKSDTNVFIALILVILYLAILLLFMLKKFKKRNKIQKDESTIKSESTEAEVVEIEETTDSESNEVTIENSDTENK